MLGPISVPADAISAAAAACDESGSLPVAHGGDGLEHSPQIGVMERHDHGDSIELPESLAVPDALLDQTLVSRCPASTPKAS